MKKNKKLKLLLLVIFSLFITVNVKASINISYNSNDDWYWATSNNGTGIFVSSPEYATFEGKSIQMYCISPMRNDDRAVNVKSIKKSNDCSNKNSFECSMIWVLKSDSTWKTKLLAARLVAEKYGKLDGDGIWGHGNTNIYNCSLKRIEGKSSSCTPYWTGGYYNAAVDLYKNATNKSNLGKLSDMKYLYTLYYAYPVNGSSYQKYYFITTKEKEEKDACSTYKKKYENEWPNYKYNSKAAKKKVSKKKDETIKQAVKRTCFIHKVCADYKNTKYEGYEYDPSKANKEVSKANVKKTCFKKKNDCDYLKEQCDKGDPTACNEYTKKACKTTDKCNISEADIKAGVVVKNAKTGEKFDEATWGLLEKYGTEAQKEAYKTYCPCDCSSPAGAINNGACNLKSGGTWNETTYKDVDDKDAYNAACPPCNFSTNKATCSNEIDCSVSNEGSYKVDLSQLQLSACASYNQKDKLQDKAYKDAGLEAVCYETYEIKYKEGIVDTGINTTLGVTKYLKFENNTNEEIDNRIQITANKICTVNGTEEAVKTAISSGKDNDDYYAAAPSLGFTYDEEINNEGFYDNITTNKDISAPVAVSGVTDSYQTTATKTYIYTPATQYYVGITNAQFYAIAKYSETEGVLFSDLVKKYNDVSDNDKKNIKVIGGSKLDGHIFPIKFSTKAQKVYYNESDKKYYLEDEYKNLAGYKYSISVNNYNFDESSINSSFTDQECNNSYNCRYVISKKDCKDCTSTCSYVCSKEVEESQKESSPYCSEVCTCEACKPDEEEPTTKSSNGLNFVYTNITTDTILDTATTTAIGENWTDQKGLDTKKAIEEASQTGETFDDKNAIYTITLDSDTIKEIKDSIKGDNSYVNLSGINCDQLVTKGYDTASDSSTVVSKDANLYYCSSDFIRSHITDEQEKKLVDSYVAYASEKDGYSIWK